MRKLLLIVIALFFSFLNGFAQIVGSDVLLQGRYIEAGLSQRFAFGVTSTPTSYHPIACCSSMGVTSPGAALAMVYDLGHDGWAVGTPNGVGDFVLPGFPAEGWSLQVGGTEYRNDYSGSFALPGSVTGYSSIGGVTIATWSGSIASINVQTKARLDTNATSIVMTVKLTNTSATTSAPLYYMRSCDPDNLSYESGGSSTQNTIVYQGDALGRAFVNASTATPYVTNFGLGAVDSRARVAVLSGLTPSSIPSAIYTAISTGSGGAGLSAYTLGSTSLSDRGIYLVFNLGTLAAGDSTEFTYAYIFEGVPGFDTTFFPCGAMAGATVVPDNDTVCGAMSLTLNATGYATGSGISYQWQSSADSITWTDISGATSVPYTVSSSSITLYYRLSTTCAVSSTTVYSPGVRVVYLPTCPCTSVVAGTASTSVSTACATTSIMLSATGYTTFGVTYRWQSSPDSATWTDISGATTIPYSFTGITASTFYRLVVTCASSTVEDFSPGVLVGYVACTCPGMTAGADSASVSTACATTPITLSAFGYTLSGVTYRWQSSPDSATWSDIPGATTVPYSFTGISSSTYYRLVVHCIASGAEENTPGVHIAFVSCTCAGLTAGTASSSVVMACPTTPVTLNATGYTATGTTYQWQSSPDGTSWTDIAGATTIPYSFTGITATTHYRLVVTCTGSGSSVMTTGIVVNYTSVCGCVPLTAGAVSSSASAACSTTVVTLSASGYTTTGTSIRWQASYDSVSWTDLPVTTASYIFTGLGVTTYYRLKVTCLVNGDTVVSAGKKISWYVCPPVSVGSASSDSEWKVYPNPVTDQLTIESPKQGFTSVVVINAVGQEVVKKQIEGVKSVVDMSSLPAGVYQVLLRGSAGSEVLKVLKLKN